MDVTLPESFSAPGKNRVELRHVDASLAPGETATEVTQYLNAAQTSHSAYTVALKSVAHQGARQFLIYEFLAWRNGGEHATTRVLFYVTSTGSFADFFKDVPFTVTDGNITASGELSIPVHSLNPASQCRAVVTPKAVPLPVYLSGTSEYTISLDCSEAASLPRLVSLRGPFAGNRQYWRSLVFESEYWDKNGPTKPVTTRSFSLLKTVVTPNVLAAVGARFRRLSFNDRPDDTIAVELTYAMQPGGLEIPLKIETPVVFYPFIWVITGSLGSGVLVGWGVSYLLLFATNQSKPKRNAIVVALPLGLLLAVVVFALGLLAYSANCRLQLFGLELNPSDVVVLFVLGLVSGCAALLKVAELRKLLDIAVDKIMKRRGATPAVLGMLVGLWCGLAHADEGPLALVGLSACPDGDVIGLHRNGTVIQFDAGSVPGTWRRAGRVSSHFKPAELTCATLHGKTTAFVLATGVGGRWTWVIRMDVATGRWTDGPVGSGRSSGITFEPVSNNVFVSFPENRTVFRLSAALKDHTQWASVYDRAESIGALAVDVARNRLLVGESFYGIVYSLALDTRRQDTFVSGLGIVNSLGVDAQRNLIYIADSARRTIWVARLAGNAAQPPRVFYRSDDLEGVSGVAVDHRSNVWVSSYVPPQVTVLDPNGNSLCVMR